MKYPLPTIARSVGRPVASVVAKVDESAATAKSPATQQRNTARFAKKCRPTRIIHDFSSRYATGGFQTSASSRIWDDRIPTMPVVAPVRLRKVLENRGFLRWHADCIRGFQTNGYSAYR